MPAAEGMAQTPQAAPSTPAPDLSDQKLDAAAAALKRVATLQMDYSRRYEDAEEPAEKDRIVAEAHDKLTTAITDQGISVEEYVSILDVAQDDAGVRGRILQRIRPADK
jgi:hypothetical protein